MPKHLMKIGKKHLTFSQFRPETSRWLHKIISVRSAAVSKDGKFAREKRPFLVCKDQLAAQSVSFERQIWCPNLGMGALGIQNSKWGNHATS